MIEFQLTQKGQVPTDAVGQAIVEAHQRGVALLLNELTKNVSGRVVQRRAERPVGARRALAASLVAKTLVAHDGQVSSQVGFEKDVAFIARFLEEGTRPHLIRPRRRRRRRGAAVLGPKAKAALSFLEGSARIARRRVQHPGIRPHPILELAVEIAGPIILQDFERALQKTLDG